MPIQARPVLAAVAAAFVASAGLAAPAFAEDVRTMTVDYKDLDLHSPAARKALDRRISAAADLVCAQSGQSLATQIDVHTCKVAATTRARAEIARATVPAA